MSVCLYVRLQELDLGKKKKKQRAPRVEEAARSDENANPDSAAHVDAPAAQPQPEPQTAIDNTSTATKSGLLALTRPSLVHHVVRILPSLWTQL